MAYSPKPAGPRTIRALFHYLWRELTEIGSELEAGGFGGEANIATSPGSGDSLVLPKEGIELPFKSLVEGANVTIDVGAETLTINSSGGRRTLIETITNVTAGEFDFDNIPGTFNKLIIEGTVRSDKVGIDSQSLLMFANDDTSPANYSTGYQFGGTTTGGDTLDAFIGVVTAATSPANAYAQVRATIGGYSNPNILAGAMFDTTHLRATGVFVFQAGWHWESTAPVTRLRIQTDNHPTDQLFGELRLYGED